MKRHKWLAGAVGLTLAVGAGGVTYTYAQPAPPAGNPAQPPATGQPGGQDDRREQRREQRQAEREKERQEWEQMTPEQRQARRQQRQEERLRRVIERAGTTDKATQDAVLAFMSDEEKARQPVREAASKVAEALRTGAVTDSQLSILLGDFRSAVTEEKARRNLATRALDAKIGYSKKPRLEAMLTMLGLVGDEVAYLGGVGGPGGPRRGMGIPIPGGNRGRGERGERGNGNRPERDNNDRDNANGNDRDNANGNDRDNADNNDRDNAGNNDRDNANGNDRDNAGEQPANDADAAAAATR